MTPERFRAIRHAASMTQAQLGAWLELTARAVRHYEAGERAIPGPVRILMRQLEKENRHKGDDNA